MQSSWIYTFKASPLFNLKKSFAFRKARQNKETMSLYTNNAERLKINDDVIGASNFRAGNGVVGTPSYSFTTSNGQDCGMYYTAPEETTK